MTLKELEETLKLAQSTIVLMVLKMAKNGFVKTYASLDDKRVKYVSLQEKGKTAYHEVRKSMMIVQDTVLAPLTSDEKIAFVSLMKKINDN